MTHEECKEKEEYHFGQVKHHTSMGYRYAKTKTTIAHPGRFRDGDASLTSRYKGVSWSASCNKWRMDGPKQARTHRRVYSFHSSETDAARAYDRAARELWGADCYLNFPDEV